MFERKRSTIDWIDIIFLVFIVCLALLPPIDEVHKQLVLLAIAIFQFLEAPLLTRFPNRGRIYSVLIKIGLATLLLDHTGEVGINSGYYPIYYLPVITAAMYFGPLATLFWTALASLAYSSFLIPALQDYELTMEGSFYLAIRILFFFLAAMVVNRFAVENRRQVERYQTLSKTLEETNRQLQRAEAEARRSERLAALGQMSAGLAHEIRNPLGVIKGSAEMLTQKLQDASPLALELAGYISSEVNRLSDFIARFLDFARPTHLELQPHRAEAILDRAISAVESRYANLGVAVERKVDNGLPDVLVDEALCERVFVNLIENAFQAMREQDAARPRLLKIAAALGAESGQDGVAITFEDTGPGVPAELREQIFNPFFTSKKDGVGLGLAIVAKIIDDHHGSIRLERSAEGAKFRVFLPAVTIGDARRPVVATAS